MAHKSYTSMEEVMRTEECYVKEEESNTEKGLRMLNKKHNPNTQDPGLEESTINTGQEISQQ